MQVQQQPWYSTHLQEAEAGKFIDSLELNADKKKIDRFPLTKSHKGTYISE